jgi:hypothetical protein
MTEKRKLYLCEKPDQAKKYSKKINPCDRILITEILGYKFNYAQIQFSNAPYTDLTPKYEINKDLYGGDINSLIDRYTKEYSVDGIHKINTLLKKYYLMRIENEDVSNSLIKEYLIGFDEIVFACDYDYTGLRTFELYFKVYCNLGDNYLDFFIKNNIKISFIKNHNSTEKLLDKSIRKKEPFLISELANNSIEHYKKKDFLEYNYTLNSILFFNEIYLIIFRKQPQNSITKNFINVLYHLKDGNKLQDYKITDYMRKKNIGNNCSRHKIFETMNKLGFLLEEEKKCNLNLKGKVPFYSLSKNGLKFIECLHTKVNDPHFTLRLDNDYKILNLTDFKIKYEKYLFNVFSKQKRLNRKIFHND